ncbi:hypothetical protein D8S78_15800 [Natrialba swarupiae]|nr:hypothetical protein [Natrialba swarupiae]
MSADFGFSTEYQLTNDHFRQFPVSYAGYGRATIGRGRSVATSQRSELVFVIALALANQRPTDRSATRV